MLLQEWISTTFKVAYSNLWVKKTNQIVCFGSLHLVFTSYPCAHNHTLIQETHVNCIRSVEQHRSKRAVMDEARDWKGKERECEGQRRNGAASSKDSSPKTIDEGIENGFEELRRLRGQVKERLDSLRLAIDLAASMIKAEGRGRRGRERGAVKQ